MADDVHPSKAVLASHALGAVPDDGERAAVERHLDHCEECQAQLREFRLAATQLVDGDHTVDLDPAALARTWDKVQRRLRS